MNPITTLKNYALLGSALPSSLQKAIAREAQHQQDVIKVMTLLPGKHSYEQVEAAINASGLYPHDIYMSLAANQHTITLAMFYEALNGPDGSKL